MRNLKTTIIGLMFFLFTPLVLEASIRVTIDSTITQDMGGGGCPNIQTIHVSGDFQLSKNISTGYYEGTGALNHVAYEIQSPCVTDTVTCTFTPSYKDGTSYVKLLLTANSATIDHLHFNPLSPLWPTEGYSGQCVNNQTGEQSPPYVMPQYGIWAGFFGVHHLTELGSQGGYNITGFTYPGTNVFASKTYNHYDAGTKTTETTIIEVFGGKPTVVSLVPCNICYFVF